MMAARPALKVRLLRPGAVLPSRSTPGASGLDLYACLKATGQVEIGHDPLLIPTGIAIELPPGYEAQVRPRSGLSAQGIGVTFGTIDSDYRGEVLVTMQVFGSRRSHTIHHGDRIAQLVVSRLADLPVVEVETISKTRRGAGGHGSTGR